MLACAASLAQAQQAATTPAPAQPTQPKPAIQLEKAPAPESGEVVQMSPFEVVTDNKGYYSANSMSGTRFNTKIEDLASSLTVVTKEQMADFAMLDINDVFLYTASTEGTGTYTSYSVDRNGSVSDNVQLNPTQANRVRGIGSANISFGNIETMGRVPVDPTGIDSIEVSRGPNANVFGLGSPAGTVNQVPASANLQKDRSQVQFRVDSYSGYRTSLDVNRVLINGKLAFRATGVFQHEGFTRKPSGVNTSRYAGMFKYQPFRSTTITAGFSFYRMNGNRPNFSPPRDNITYWKSVGMPTWDPLTNSIHLGGATLGPYTASTYNGPDYFNNSFTGSNHSFLYIDQNGVGNWTMPSATNNVTLLSSSYGTNTSGAPVLRLMSASAGTGIVAGKPGNQPLFTTTPTVSDKAIYDYTSINLASVNRVMDRMYTSSFQIDQFLLNTPMQTLVAQVGFLREDSTRFSRNLIGIGNDNGQSGQLLVDVNERNLDGTINPYFLRTYIGTDQPRTTWEPAKWDTYRLQLAYRLDLSKEHGLLKYLGTHMLTGYNEYKYRVSKRYSYRDAMTDAHAWLPYGVPRGNQGSQLTVGAGTIAAPPFSRMYFRYYLGDNQGANVDYAPSDFSYGSYNFTWGGVGGVFNREPTTLGQAAVIDSTGGGSNSLTVLKTRGGVIQSNFLEGAVVTTFGLREDKVFVKNGITPVWLNPDGVTFNLDTIDHWLPTWKYNVGKTKTAGVVARPFRDLGFVRSLDQGSGGTSILGSLLKGLSFTLNKSDSFTPQDPKMNVYLQDLPNTTGTGKDYGFGLNLMDGKLVIRYNQYDNSQMNSRGGDASTIAQRILRTDVASTAAFLLQTQARNWTIAANPTWTTQQVEDQVDKEMGMPATQRTALMNAFNAGQIASTNDITAKGKELEINYNPTRYWTVSASGTDMQSINSNVSKDISDWIAQRMPIWTTVTDKTPGRGNPLWWNYNYGGSQTAAQNYLVFIQTPFSVVQQQDGKANNQMRRYAARVSTSFQLAAVNDSPLFRKLTVGGAFRWESKGGIGYYGVQQLPASITQLDASRPIYDKEHTYIDTFLGYKTRIYNNKVVATIRFNVRNVFEGGGLRPIGAYPDGTPHSYRIIDPRQFILTATFDL
jgi:outer membrane receptor for ferric coprogen and ferric-rhodotorulic acid